MTHRGHVSTVNGRGQALPAGGNFHDAYLVLDMLKMEILSECYILRCFLCCSPCGRLSIMPGAMSEFPSVLKTVIRSSGGHIFVSEGATRGISEPFYETIADYPLRSPISLISLTHGKPNAPRSTLIWSIFLIEARVEYDGLLDVNCALVIVGRCRSVPVPMVVDQCTT